MVSEGDFYLAYGVYRHGYGRKHHVARSMSRSFLSIALEVTRQLLGLISEAYDNHQTRRWNQSSILGTHCSKPQCLWLSCAPEPLPRPTSQEGIGKSCASPNDTLMAVSRAQMSSLPSITAALSTKWRRKGRIVLAGNVKVPDALRNHNSHQRQCLLLTICQR